VTLVVYLHEVPGAEHSADAVETAVRHYFAYRAEINALEFSRMMKDGRVSLFIGLAFLTVCLVASEMLAQVSASPMMVVLRESLTIGGWVAMWRPLEIYLYEWWPVRRLGRVYDRMSRTNAELHVRRPAAERAVP
jgi:hypothetical protein